MIAVQGHQFHLQGLRWRGRKVGSLRHGGGGGKRRDKVWSSKGREKGRVKAGKAGGVIEYVHVFLVHHMEPTQPWEVCRSAVSS